MKEIATPFLEFHENSLHFYTVPNFFGYSIDFLAYLWYTTRVCGVILSRKDNKETYK